MPAAKAGPAVTSNRIDFVDENNARSVLLALFEQIAHAARANADEHLDEIRTRDREERNVRFTSNRPRQQSLARPGGPDKQYTLGNASTEFLEFLRIFQEVDNFVELFFGLIDSGHVLERCLLLLGGQQSRARFSKTERFVPARLHLFHHENPEQNQQDKRSKRREEIHPIGVLHFLEIVRNVVVLQSLCYVWNCSVGDRYALKFRCVSVLALQFGAVRRQINHHIFHAAALYFSEKVCVVRLVLVRRLAAGRCHLPQHYRQQNHQKPE